MGSIVFAAGASHAPHITAFPDRAEAGARDRIYAAMNVAGEGLRAARPDVLVVVSSDHFTNLFSDRMPAFCVGTAQSYEGPVEDWIRLPRGRVAGHPAFARAILDEAFASGIEAAFAGSLALEHGVSVPLSFMDPAHGIPIVPVLQNCMVPPLPKLARCFAMGQAIRRAAEASDLRVAVLGTGGLSHAPGAPEAGRIDEEFDRDFIAAITSDRPTGILDIPNARIDAAGFGTWEIRQWATALGAAGGAPARVLAYEAMPAWEGGYAVATFGAN